MDVKVGRPKVSEDHKKLMLEKNRKDTCQRIKEKYKQDPEFREKMLERSKAYGRKLRNAFKQVQV